MENINKKDKIGFAKIGFLKNFNSYVGELKNLTGDFVDITKLNSFIEEQLENKEQIYLNKELEVVEEEQITNKSKFVMIKTGLFTKETVLPIWGGFRSETPGKYIGIELGTYEELIQKWQKENNKSDIIDLENFTYINDFEHITKVLNLKRNLTYYKEQWVPILKEEFERASNEKSIGVYVYKNKGMAYFKLSFNDIDGNELWVKMDKNTHYSNRHPWFGIFLVSRDDLIEEIYRISNYCLGTMVFEKNENFDGLKRFVEDVATQALKENWDLNDENEKNYRVLRNYLENTLVHLELEDKKCKIEKKKKVMRINGKAFFNSGLLNKGLADLYIVGEDKNITFSPELLGDLTFNVIYNPRVYERTHAMIRGTFPTDEDCPKMAEYFTGQEPPNFKTALSVTANEKHICEDNLERILPKTIYDRIKDDKNELDNWSKKIQINFKSAVEQSRKLAARSFRLAVPQFSPETEKIQFLLPICLKFSDTDNEVFVSDDYSQPCCVLVLASEGEGRDERYEGKTVLTLSMAYNNARLIERPGVTWLDKITH